MAEDQAPEVRRNDVFAQQETQPSRMVPRGAEQKSPESTIPTESCPLPSSGKVYSASHPLHLADSVGIRTMTARDEDILTSRALAKNGTVITHLLRSCIVDKRVDPGSLLSGDRNALMVAIRITGYGREYDVEVTCPDDDCGEKSDYTFDLAQLPVKRLELDPVNLGENLFTINLPSGTHALWRFMTGRDEEELTQAANAKKKAKLADEGLVTSRLTRMLVALNGEKDRGKIAQLVQNMPVSDSRAFRNFVQDNEPGIEMKGLFTCPACGESTEVDVPFGASFFWPGSRKS